MEIDEVVARVVRQYWALVAFCIVLPLVGVALITIKQPPLYGANARIITSSIVPASSAEADAIVSQVQGLSTSRSAASKALRAAHITRNLTDFTTNHITVSGLGSSQVVDLTVTDRNRQVAEHTAKALATEVTNSLNNVGQSGLIGALKAIDDQVVTLSQQRASLAAHAGANPQNQQTQAKLAGLDEVIANLNGDRGRLLAQASTQGRATVIDAPTLPVHSEPKGMPQKLALAGLLGLVLGILLASLVETIRPTVPGARRVSRRLGAPLLGRLNQVDLRGDITAGVEYLGLRLRLAAKHADVSNVALASVGAGAAVGDLGDFGNLAAALDRAMIETSPDGTGTFGLGVGLTANSHQVTTQAGDGIGRVGTLVQGRYLAGEQEPARHVYPLGQLNKAAEKGRVGLLVLAGPVARVSDVAALADLVASAGWPLLGVVAVPRRPRKQSTRAHVPASPPVVGAPGRIQPPGGGEGCDR